MFGKPGRVAPVVHAKAVFDDEVVSKIPAGKGDCRSKVSITFRIRVLVMSAEEERVVGFEGKAQFFNQKNWHHDSSLVYYLGGNK